MLIKKNIHFAPEYRCKSKQKNGEKEVIQVNLPLRMRVSFYCLISKDKKCSANDIHYGLYFNNNYFSVCI